MTRFNSNRFLNCCVYWFIYDYNTSSQLRQSSNLNLNRIWRCCYCIHRNSKTVASLEPRYMCKNRRGFRINFTETKNILISISKVWEIHLLNSNFSVSGCDPPDNKFVDTIKTVLRSFYFKRCLSNSKIWVNLNKHS
jgi:hypothetical protein